MRSRVLLLVAIASGFLAACGSGGPPGTWSQTGSEVHAFWTVPSGSSVDLELTGAASATNCRTTSKGKSEMATILMLFGVPAAYIPIGKTIQAGSRAQTSCLVTGTVTAVSYGGTAFKHVRAP